MATVLIDDDSNFGGFYDPRTGEVIAGFALSPCGMVVGEGDKEQCRPITNRTTTHHV